MTSPNALLEAMAGVLVALLGDSLEPPLQLPWFCWGARRRGSEVTSHGVTEQRPAVSSVPGDPCDGCSKPFCALLWKSSLGLALGLLCCSQRYPRALFCLDLSSMREYRSCSAAQVMKRSLACSHTLPCHGLLRFPELSSQRRNPQELMGVAKRRC